MSHPTWSLCLTGLCYPLTWLWRRVFLNSIVNHGLTFYSGASLRENSAFKGCILFLFISFYSFFKRLSLWVSKLHSHFQFSCENFNISMSTLIWNHNLDSGRVFCVRFLIWIHCFPAPKRNVCLNLYPFLTFAASISCSLVEGPAGGDAPFVVLWIHTYRIYGRIPHVLFLMNELLNGLGAINGANLLRKQPKDHKRMAVNRPALVITTIQHRAAARSIFILKG